MVERSLNRFSGIFCLPDKSRIFPNSRDDLAGNMCPDGEGPGCVANEVGVEGAGGKVVHAFVGASVVQLSHRHPPTVVGPAFNFSLRFVQELGLRDK
jgi:hypothetical protein